MSEANHLPVAGTRIELLHMPDDPNPIPPGTRGTVRKARRIPGLGTQIEVDWDIPRSLSLVERDVWITVDG